MNRQHIVLYNAKIWVSQHWVETTLEIGEKYLEKVRYDKSFKSRKSWAYERLDGVFYYLAESIPKIGERVNLEALKHEAVNYDEFRLEGIKTAFKQQINEQINSGFSTYYENKCGYSLEKSQELTLANAVISVVQQAVEGKNHKSFGLKKMQLWELLQTVALEVCPHRLNYSNLRSFINRINDLPTEVEALKEALVDGRKNNDNSRKFGKSANKLVNTNTGEVFNYCTHELLIYGLWVNIGGHNKLTKEEDFSAICGGV